MEKVELYRNGKNWQNLLKIRKEFSEKAKPVKKNNKKELLNHRPISETINKNNSRNFYQIFKQKLTKYNPPNFQMEREVGKESHSSTDISKIL